jgi:hypothetical protein
MSSTYTADVVFDGTKIEYRMLEIEMVSPTDVKEWKDFVGHQFEG